MDPAQVRRIIQLLASHPVLPPAEELPSNDDALHTLLADLARGDRSTHAEPLREVGDTLMISVEELARRAEFLLACLVVPVSGTHYDVLRVAPDASPREIRKRWAFLIQRYHPDRFGGGGSGWLEGQARRLIEAYEMLRDPERRRQYDAQLGGGRFASAPLLEKERGPQWAEVAGSPRWRWVPAGILVFGLAASLWVYTRPVPAPLPAAHLPPSPKLLDHWAGKEAKKESDAPRPKHPAALPSLKERPRESAFTPASTPSAPLPLLVGSLDSPLVGPSTPTEATEPTLSESSGRPIDIPVADASAVRPAPPAPRAEKVEPQAEPAIASPRAPAPAAGATAPSPPVAAVPPSAQASPAHEPLALIEAFRSAYERGDLRIVMELFGPAPRERQVMGRSTLQELYARNFAGLDNIRYELAQLHVMAAPTEGDVIVQGRFRIRATRVGDLSRPLDVAGPIRWVLRREAGALRIVGIDYEVGAP